MKKIIYSTIIIIFIIMLISCNKEKLEFQEVSPFSEELAAVKVNEGYCYIDKNGNLSIKHFYDKAEEFRNGIAWVKKDNYWGVINKNGEYIINPKYENIQSFLDQIYVVKGEEGFGCVDSQGKEVVSAVFNKVDPVNEEYVIVKDKDNYKYGCINIKSDDIIINPIYDKIDFQFSNEIIFVRKSGKWGLLDTKGNVVFPPKYIYISSFSNSIALARTEDYKYSLINTNGDVVKELEFNGLDINIDNTKFHEGFTIIESNDKFGYINEKGEIIAKPKYESARRFYNGMARVKYEGKWGAINKQGKMIIKPAYEEIGLFAENIAPICYKYDDENKYGYINNLGEVIVEPKYDDFTHFQNGVAQVGINNKYGIINIEGKEIIKPIYDEIQHFPNNALLVTLQDKKGLFKRNGKQLTEVIFEKIDYHVSDGLILVKKHNKWGFIDLKGKTIIEPKYDDVTYFNNGLAFVQLNANWICIDKTGNKIF